MTTKTTRALMPKALTERTTRGYEFLPASLLNKAPNLYATDDQGMDATVLAHYFIGGADWFITEIDPDTFDAFGWAEIVAGCGELGYTNLMELANARTRQGMAIDRDLYWEPCTLQEAIARRERNAGRA